MKIVIDIPEEIYQKIKETNRVISGRRSGKRIDYIFFNAINTGIPLPKGHGKLIDADELLKAIDTWDKFGVDDTGHLFRLDNLSLPHYVPYTHYDDMVESISGAETIIEAEKTTINHEKTTITDGDLISRESVKDLIRGLTKWGVRSQDGKFENVGLLYDDVMFGIDRLPSAEKTAEWIDLGNVIQCSNCETLYPKVRVDLKHYCERCGSRMKGVE